MTKFEDQLLADLMAEHRPVLQHLERPAARATARRPVRRVAWLTGVATAAAVTVGVLLPGGSPAYAVTQNPDGTVTVSIASPAGVQPANARLHVLLGDSVVVVPVRAGCPSLASLPKPKAEPRGKVTVSGSGSGGGLTADAHGIPAGDILLIAARSLPHGGMQLAGALTSGPAPRCVSLPAPPPGRSGSTRGNVSGHA